MPKFGSGTGEMDQQLKILAALAEDTGLVPQTHMAVHSHLSPSVTGEPIPSLASTGPRHIHSTHTL